MSEYPFPLYDEKGKVVCQICGKSFMTISPRHLRNHNVSYSDYFKRFPNAPKSNEEFAARSKYGKDKVIFKDQEEKEDIIGEDILVEEDPEIVELPIQKEVERLINKVSPMENMKNKFRDHLQLYFTNIKQDHLIREFGKDHRLKFEFITDFCDPALKVVIQFPDTFWHNREISVDLNKKLKLEQCGWKVIEILGASPDLKKIDEEIKEQY
jgi:very-short-patch-repair endonuclease